MADKPTKTTYIMLKDGRPDEGEQRAAARAWGVNVDGSYAGVFLDDVRKVKRTTSPAKVLVERENLFNDLKQAGEGEQVFFHTPLCLGFSQQDAEMTIRTVIERGAKVYIHHVKDAGSLLIGKGDGLEGVLERFQSDYNAHAMRRTRARGNAKRKPNQSTSGKEGQ